VVTAVEYCGLGIDPETGAIKFDCRGEGAESESGGIKQAGRVRCEKIFIIGICIKLTVTITKPKTYVQLKVTFYITPQEKLF